MTQQYDDSHNPWLDIPWQDYEGHMAHTNVRQSQFLSDVFRGVLREYKPNSIAVLGCATGNGFEHLDPAVIHRVTAVDINPYYLEILNMRFGSEISGLELICDDLATCELEAEAYDLVYCALIFEYLEPRSIIEKIALWLRPHGKFVVVLQLPSKKQGKISETI